MQTAIINIGETTSTNDYLKQQAESFQQHDIVIVSAEHQTCGRGQGTNKWESEAHQNLLFSILVHPTCVAATEQFVLSMAEALAVRAALTKISGEEFALKWPNDIYWHDRKLGGTLIETALAGRTIKQCVIGTGLNINQTRFLSDAPNPVSLAQITGREWSRQEVLGEVASAFEHYYLMALEHHYDIIAAEYHSALYRRTGFHPYRDARGEFSAAIARVDLNGTLHLQLPDGSARSYAFKEVSIVI